MRLSGRLPWLAMFAYCVGVHILMLRISCPGCPTSVLAAEQAGFTDITETSGVAALVDDQYAAHPQWWLSGLHLVDLDTDGNLDLFLSTHGRGPALAVLGDGAGRFARAAGDYPSSEIHLAYDSDEDGKVDLTMTHQDGGGQWWHNRSRPGRLDFRATGITRGTNTARRQAMIDINRDGHADWLRGTGRGILFDFGNGRGGFVSNSRMLAVAAGRAEVLCLPQDVDGDGDMDLLTEWGHYENANGTSRILCNDGRMHFADVTAAAGLPQEALSIKGTGDVDQDGDPDLICLKRRQTFAIYLNDGSGHFTEKAGAVRGVEKGAAMASWGIAVTTDFDNDGLADILANGKHFLKILRGVGGGSFQYMNAVWDIRDLSASSVDDGLCFGDFDNDGDLDIVGYASIDGQRRIAVYRNDLPARNWLRVRPVGRAGNRPAAGAIIRVCEPATGRLLWREQVAIYDSQSASSYYAAAQTERHFGLGSRTHVDVSVEFYPSGAVVWKRGGRGGQTLAVEEPEETPGP
ncbi:MAG: VCBS repeat-containing protein [Pirellulales bacterium]|nr:VCBS repeat-containing protein [Pirellulales bacterium]